MNKKELLTIKRIIILMLIATLSVGCQDVKHKGKHEEKTELSDGIKEAKEIKGTELNIAGKMHRIPWNEKYNDNKPVQVKSTNEWIKLVKDTKADEGIQKKYDDNYFKDNVVYAYMKNESSGSTKVTVEKAIVDGDKLHLFITRDLPKLGTMDMATTLCLFEIKKEDIVNVKSIEKVQSTNNVEE